MLCFPGTCFAWSQGCYFKLIFKDVEILQIDPVEFLPFSLAVGNLLWQPKYEVSFESQIYKICIHVSPCFECCLGPTSGTCGLNQYLCLFLLAVSSVAVPIPASVSGTVESVTALPTTSPHCIGCGEPWVFCSLVQCHLVAIWPCSVRPLLSLKTWTNVEGNHRSSKRCGDIQS